MLEPVIAALEGLSPAVLAFCVVAMFVAAFIRGFTGFGSSLMWVPSLSLVLPPVAVLPITFLLEVGISLHLVPSVRHEADWPSVVRIVAGAALGVPVGLTLLVAISDNAARAGVAATVIVAAVLFWRGMRLKRTFSSTATVSVGAAAGLLMGSVGIPGPPIFLYYLAAPIDIRISRASIIVLIFAVALVSCLFAWFNGMLDRDAILRAALLLPVVLFGSYLGSHAFGRTDSEKARRFALGVLFLMGAVLLLRAIFAG
jgi:uncharacterized membrane protein YfcA